MVTVERCLRCSEPQECEAQGRRHVSLGLGQEVAGGSGSHPEIRLQHPNPS